MRKEAKGKLRGGLQLLHERSGGTALWNGVELHQAEGQVGVM